MISKDAGYELIVKEHGRTEFTAYEVNTANVQGKTLYYLQKGTSADTIVGVIQKQRRALKLYTPFQEQDWDEEDEEDDADTDEEKESTEDVPIDKENAHLLYFWGDITSGEADEILKDKDPGSFLVRKNRDIYKLSWKSLQRKHRHAHIDLEKYGTVYDQVEAQKKLGLSHSTAI